MLEGKLLRHIISKDGIRIYPSRVEAIQKIDFLRSKKEVQSFLGRVNFLTKFTPNCTKVVTVITIMLRKESGLKWTSEVK